MLPNSYTRLYTQGARMIFISVTRGPRGWPSGQKPTHAAIGASPSSKLEMLGAWQGTELPGTEGSGRGGGPREFFPRPPQYAVRPHICVEFDPQPGRNRCGGRRMCPPLSLGKQRAGGKQRASHRIWKGLASGRSWRGSAEKNELCPCPANPGQTG